MNQQGTPSSGLTDESGGVLDDSRARNSDTGSIPALELLRDRVVRAVEEITRLRSTNAELAERVRHLEQLHGVSNASSFVLDEDPEALKEKISGYIKAIDAYLEEADEMQADTD